MSCLVKNCTGVILAGGENRRMPVLKAFIAVDGKKIIERTLKTMKHLFNEIFIVTNQPEMYSYLEIPLLGDMYDVRGPMTGVFTSLVNSSNQWVFISACDMPFINADLIRYMAEKRDRNDAVVPKSPLSPRGSSRFDSTKAGLKGEYTESLFAFYLKRLIPSMERAIISGKTGLNDFLDNKKVKYISTREIKKIDPEAKLFINMNTPEDIKLYLSPGDVSKALSPKKILREGRKKCLALDQQN